MTSTAPLNDTILVAVSKLVDDGTSEKKRQPSHADLEFQFDRAGLSAFDPAKAGQTLGKAKRVRAVLSAAIDHDLASGEKLVGLVVSAVRGHGGFRPDSENYVGGEAIESARIAFQSEGYDLGLDGSLQPVILDSLSGQQLTEALCAYVRRARSGVADAALLAGTSKDLLEATAAHVLMEKWGSYPQHSNFPTLLGQAFTALGFATPHQPVSPGEPTQMRMQRSLYETACSINAIRNKQGTGHGRPWVSSVTDVEARVAVELMGAIAEYMLAAI